MGPLGIRGWRALPTYAAFTISGACASNVDCGGSGDSACRMHLRWHASLNGQPGPSAEPQKTSAQPRKKAKQPAGQNEKAHAKREQEAPRATAPAKGDKPAVQEQAADSISQKPAEAAPTVVPSSREDQPLNAESRNENLVATAAAAWPIIPNTAGTGAGGAAANADAVQLVDPNEVNDLDR